MSLPTLPDQPVGQHARSMPERFPPRRRTLPGVFWALVELLHKKRIEWEDRRGLYGYDAWIRSVERPQQREMLRFAKALPAASVTFDFVISGGELSAQGLERTLLSLRQIQAKWTLVVALPDSAPVEIVPGLGDLKAREPSLDLVITKASSSQQSGDWMHLLPHLNADWVVPLRCGDTLSPCWLSAFLVHSSHFPQADLFYWDEDEQQPSGGRCHPFFKPGWSPELLYGCNYLESAAYRKKLLAVVYETSQLAGESLLFAITAAAQDPQRIPFVLQHRAPLMGEDRERLLESHAAEVKTTLERRGCKDVKIERAAGRLAGGRPFLRVCWKPQPALVSIIIPTKNQLAYLKRCLDTLIEKTRENDYEIILMDDHSDAAEVLAYYQDVLSLHSNIRLYANEGPFNYSRVNNQGARHARGDLLLFLNNDVEILESGWLEEMVRWTQSPGIGMTGAKLLYPNGAVQHAGIVLGMTGHAGHLFAGREAAQGSLFLSADCCRNVSAVTGACMMVRREVFEQLGGFDENLMLVFNDVELGARFRQHGWRVIYTPYAALVHHEGMSRSRYMPPGDIRLGAEKLSAEIMQGDCCYNPNLSLAVNWPTFRRPYEQDALRRLKLIARYKG